MSEKYALLGAFVNQSLSPKIYEYLAKRLARDMSYELLNITDEEGLKGLINSGLYSGFNVTMPYKRAVLSYCAAMSEEVRVLKSANTLIKEGSTYKAYSTDGEGFVASLSYHGVKTEGSVIYLYGLGGASRPIAYSLIGAGCSKIYYESRSEESEEGFRTLLFPVVGDRAVLESARALEQISCDIAINASCYGSSPESRPSIDLNRVGAPLYYDIIYVRETELLKEARADGKKVIGGLDMLIAQALYAFQLFCPDVRLPEGLFFELKSYLEA